LTLFLGFAAASSHCRADDLHIPSPFTGPSDDEVSRETVRLHVHARRLRERYFDEGLFANPAWDMVLDLFDCELSGRPVSVSSLCLASGVPQTTALRRINLLVKKGLFIRRDDPEDGRRVLIQLSPEANIAIRRYCSELAKSAAG